MFPDSKSGNQGDIHIPGSVLSVRSVEKDSSRLSRRSPSRTSPGLFCPTFVPIPSSPPISQSSPNYNQFVPSLAPPTPASLKSTPPPIQSPPPSVASYLDLSLSSAITRHSVDISSQRKPRLNSSLSSDISVTIFSPESSISLGGDSDIFVASTGTRHNTPVSERTLSGRTPVPSTPSFIPLVGNLVILSKQASLEFPAKVNEVVVRDQAVTKSNGFARNERSSASAPTFITLPGSAVTRPQSGWLEREFTTVGLTQPQQESNGISYPLRNGFMGRSVSLLRDARSNTVAPSGMPSVDTQSVNGFFCRPAANGILQSSTTSDPDAVGMGVMSVTTSRADLVAAEDDDEESGECGWLCLRPKSLQKTRTAKWVLFWLCWAAAAQGMVVNGFVNVCITSIEKRFDLRSFDTGLIAGAYDIASVLCSIPVSYMGSRPGSSKPRWLGWGVFIMGMGSFVFTLPHFASPFYDPSGSDSTLSLRYCFREGPRESRCGVLVENWLSSFRHIFVLGQFLHGVGASPLYTLGITYLDESVPVKMSSMYLGIFYAMAVIGPAFGYLLGGQFLKVYIDAPSVDPVKFSLHPNSDLWLGGWWMGFLVSGSISILISWPIMAFPSQLPGAKAIKAERVSEAHGAEATSGRSSGGFGRLRDLPQAVKVLTLNPTFVSLSLAGATEGILLAGFATFMPKFLENQFSMPASFAALLVGFVVVPAGGGGTLLGGWLVKRLQLRCSGILKMCIIFSFLCLLSCLTFVISCPNIDFAGVSVDYQNRTIIPPSPNLTSSCNAECSCDDIPYDPICGTNNIMYFSPCHAGCSGMEKGQDGLKVFTGCKCVKSLPVLTSTPFTTTTASTTSSSGTLAGDARLAADSALREKCPTACSLMPIFLVIFFIVMTLTFIISLPALSGTLRCVPDTHRSFALGLQWIVVRLLGTIPGPILFGALIDNTCTLWQSTCGVQGSCRSYDNFYMSRYMMGISIIAKALSTILFFLAWYLYVPPKSSHEETQPNGVAGNSGPPPPSAVSKDAKEMSELRGIDNPAAELT